MLACLCGGLLELIVMAGITLLSFIAGKAAQCCHRKCHKGHCCHHD